MTLFRVLKNKINEIYKFLNFIGIISYPNKEVMRLNLRPINYKYKISTTGKIITIPSGYP